MKVGELKKRLATERDDEEVNIIIGQDTNNYYTIDERPFRRGGPVFYEEPDGSKEKRSSILIKVFDG